MSDKKTIHGSISSIRKERKHAEEFRFALSGNKIITFKDPTTMSPDDYDKTLAFGARNGAVPWREVLHGWLSDEDRKKVEQEVADKKMDIYELLEMVGAAQKHYDQFFGTPGE